MADLLASIGRLVLQFLAFCGQLAVLTKEIFISFFIGKKRLALIFQQIVSIGFGSQLVIVVTGAFTGAVFAAQVYFMFNEVGLDSAVGAVVSIALCRELAPVLTGLMVAGRVGASMTAEIGTMKVTEQIDALRALAVHPVDYLVQPRVIGMMISMPLLIAESLAFGLAAAYVVSVVIFNVPSAWYMTHLSAHTELIDIGIGMFKGFVFGILTVIIACHQGLTVTNGAVGVGQNTTASVVISSLAILISNFFLSILTNIISPIGIG